MIISRGSSVLKKMLHGYKSATSARKMSHAQWNYRCSSKPDRKIIENAEYVGGFFWWWILWHFWTDYEHITGEFSYPDPSKWTDEELGIQ